MLTAGWLWSTQENDSGKRVWRDCSRKWEERFYQRRLSAIKSGEFQMNSFSLPITPNSQTKLKSEVTIVSFPPWNPIARLSKEFNKLWLKLSFKNHLFISSVSFQLNTSAGFEIVVPVMELLEVCVEEIKICNHCSSEESSSWVRPNGKETCQIENLVKDSSRENQNKSKF